MSTQASLLRPPPESPIWRTLAVAQETHRIAGTLYALDPRRFTRCDQHAIFAARVRYEAEGTLTEAQRRLVLRLSRG